MYNIFWGIWLILKCFVPSPDTFILPEYVKKSYIQKVYVVKNNVNQIVFLRLYNFSCFLLSVKILHINNIKQYIGHNKIHQVLIYIYISLLHILSCRYTWERNRKQLFSWKKWSYFAICKETYRLCCLKVKLTNLLKEILNIFINEISYLLQIHYKLFCLLNRGFPDSSVGKESACDAGDPALIPGSGRSTGEGIGYPFQYSWASLVAQLVKNLPAVWETWVPSLGWEDLLEKGKATHSSILAWRIPKDRGAWQATV